MGFFACSLFFLRFWKKTADKFFLAFAFAFLALGLERLVLAFFSPRDEFRPFVYLIRLSAFLLVIVAIAVKNQTKR